MEFEQFTIFNVLISQGCNSGNFGDNENNIIYFKIQPFQTFK